MLLFYSFHFLNKFDCFFEFIFVRLFILKCIIFYTSDFYLIGADDTFDDRNVEK